MIDGVVTGEKVATVTGRVLPLVRDHGAVAIAERSRDDDCFIASPKPSMPVSGSRERDRKIQREDEGLGTRSERGW